MFSREEETGGKDKERWIEWSLLAPAFFLISGLVDFGESFSHQGSATFLTKLD